jgi:hypothetical protein
MGELVSLRGLRLIWESPIAKALLSLGVALLVLSLVGFGVAFKHRSEARALENKVIERGYAVEAEALEMHYSRLSASRANGFAFLLLLGAGAAAFAGTVAGLPSKRRIDSDPAIRSGVAESGAGRWDRWTRGRALGSGIGIALCFVVGLGLWIVGSLRATRFINISFPNQPGEELHGAIEFILGTLLMIGAPTTVALLRRTTFWKWAAAVTAVLVGGLTALALAGWPPESSWTF